MNWLHQNMKEVTLHSFKYPGMVALVDDEDWPRVEPYRWWPDKRFPQWYARARVNGCLVYMHRFLRPDLPEVDHRDGNGLNNQQYNLRDATRGQQGQNKQRNLDKKASGFKGVFPTGNKQNPWRAMIRLEGRSKHLGVFPTEEDAARAYDTAASRAFGAYAKMNFTEE